MNEVDNLIVKFQSSDKQKYEAMVFNYETVPLTDFRHGRILEPRTKTEYKEPQRSLKPWKDPQKDAQTLTTWNVKVPFDLFMKPKDIVQTDPRKIQKHRVAEEDLEREEVRKTRPRVVLTPEVSIDDVDERTLKIVLNDKYISTTHKEYRGFDISNGKSVVSPLVPILAPANPIKIQTYAPRVVSPEWRMESVSWGGRQLRSFCDPTAEFWTKQRQMDQPKGEL